MTVCAVLGCDTRSGAVQSRRRRRLHIFPRDSSRREQWILACGRGENFVPTPYHMVCSRHFLNGDYSGFGAQNRSLKRKELKPDSVPTQCLPTSSSGEVHVTDQGQLHLPVQAGPSDQIRNPAEEVTYLRTKVAGLEALDEQKTKLVDDVRKENNEYKEAFQRIYFDDQIHRIMKPKSRKKFSSATMKRAIMTYYTCGSAGYKLLREQGN